ncbi:MAG TPA: aminopeptidase [Spirochaetales bacterium]|nr:aminopeptidase [Spirochaetales bacterium]
MSISLEEGAGIVIHKWLHVKPAERVTIIFDELHIAEAMALRDQVALAHGIPMTIQVPSEGAQSGGIFETYVRSLVDTDILIGATDSSIMTTRTISDAVTAGARFLSLPLSTNDGISLLKHDFLKMDLAEVESDGSRIQSQFVGASTAHVTTKLGTDLRFSVQGRRGNVFSGRSNGMSTATSASFEFSIAVEEDRTEGVLMLDGSMGYLGLVTEPMRMILEKGRIVDIEKNDSGRKLAAYFSEFDDEEMYVVGELGIGLNRISQCAGRSYIEDESAYGTFHIGVGRNISLGGRHYANGHFDLVTHAPTIEVDGKLVMKDGELSL